MQTFYLGIDASKGYADFIILNKQKEVIVDNFQLDDTFEGHCLLYEHIMNFLNEHKESIICAAVESTGGYEKIGIMFYYHFRGP